MGEGQGVSSDAMDGAVAAGEAIRPTFDKLLKSEGNE